MEPIALKRSQVLVSTLLAAAGSVIGILVGLKYKHPVAGFFIGGAVSSVVSGGYIFATTPETPASPPTLPAPQSTSPRVPA